MENAALIFKIGFGKDESVVLVSPKAKKYKLISSVKRSDIQVSELKRFSSNRIEVCGVEFIVDDGPLITSSRTIGFFHEGLEIFEFRAPKLSERFRWQFLRYSWQGFVFVGICNFSFPKISEIVLLCLDSFSYYGEPEAW